MESINFHYHSKILYLIKLLKKLGNNFYLSWFDLGVAAFILVQEGNNDAAIAVIENLKSYHPESAHVANFSASVLEMIGNNNALKEYQRTLELVNKYNLHPNFVHKSSINEAIKRLTKSE